MIAFPNAKINLGLNITERRYDGYHNLDTLFYPINLCDSLEFIVSNETTFKTSGIEIEGNPEDNLILKAYNLLKQDYQLPNLDIYLIKNIPMGAGMGGGSSDATSMLMMINEEFSLNINQTKLEKYASQLGADCSFFLHNKPILASGIGNIFTDCNVDLSQYYIVIVKPNIHISTVDAYKNCKPQQWNIPLQKAITYPIEEWKEMIFNDFENTIFKNQPKLKNIKSLLYSKGAKFALMSGSGSSIYGLFNQPIDLEEINLEISKILEKIDFKTFQLKMK